MLIVSHAIRRCRSGSDRHWAIYLMPGDRVLAPPKTRSGNDPARPDLLIFFFFWQPRNGHRGALAASSL